MREPGRDTLSKYVRGAVGRLAALNPGREPPAMLARVAAVAGRQQVTPIIGGQDAEPGQCLIIEQAGWHHMICRRGGPVVAVRAHDRRREVGQRLRHSTLPLGPPPLRLRVAGTVPLGDDATTGSARSVGISRALGGDHAATLTARQGARGQRERLSAGRARARTYSANWRLVSQAHTPGTLTAKLSAQPDLLALKVANLSTLAAVVPRHALANQDLPLLLRCI